MKNIIPVFILFFGMLLSSCGDGITHMSYVETKCADPWENASNDSREVLLENVQKYLDDEMIATDRIYIAKDAIAQDCEACNCTSDRRVYADVLEAEIAALMAIGFVIN